MNMIALSQDRRYLENSDGRSMQGIVFCKGTLGTTHGNLIMSKLIKLGVVVLAFI